MKKSNKKIITFLIGILVNMLIFEQSVFADVTSPMESLKQPSMLIFFGVCIAIIVAIAIFAIIAAKKNK